MEALGRGRARIRKLVGDASKSGNLSGSRPPGSPSIDSNSLVRTVGGRGFSDGEIAQIEGGISSLTTSGIRPSEGNRNLEILESPKETLVKDLEKLKEGKFTKRCLIRITIDFLSQESDVEFYVDKIFEYTLESSLIGKEFAKSMKFLTSHMVYGEELKILIFKKLQSTFTDMSVYMKDSVNLPQETKTSLVNFCNLIGQIYFRYRPNLKDTQRYYVLAIPTINCLSYLLSACGKLELQTLAKLFIMNCKNLFEHYKDQVVPLYDEARSALVNKELSSEERLWLMCVIEYFHAEGNHLPEETSRFYESHAGKSLWREVSLDKTSDRKVILLANLPIDFNMEDAKKFDLDPSLYSKSRIVDL